MFGILESIVQNVYRNSNKYLLQKFIFFLFRDMPWEFQNKEMYEYVQHYTVGVKNWQV